MDEAQNGHSAVLRLLDGVPETRVVLVAGRELRGYVRGKRCKRSVEAAFFDAWEQGRVEREMQVTDPESGEPRTETYMQYENRQARQHSWTLQVLAVVPGITYDEADSLNELELQTLMESLGWWVKLLRPEGDDASGEAAAALARTLGT